MITSEREVGDLAKVAAGSRALRNGRVRRALIARLLSEQEGAEDVGEEGADEEGGDEDGRIMRALVGSRVLKRRRLRKLLLAHLIKQRSEAGDEADEGDEDTDEAEDEGGDDRQVARLLVGSRMLRRRRVRKAVLAYLIRERNEGEAEDGEDFEASDDIGEDGTESGRKFVKLLVGSRVLRRRRVRRAVVAKLLRDRNDDD